MVESQPSKLLVASSILVSRSIPHEHSPDRRPLRRDRKEARVRVGQAFPPAE
jgi:hypothetical protein